MQNEHHETISSWFSVEFFFAYSKKQNLEDRE